MIILKNCFGEDPFVHRFMIIILTLSYLLEQSTTFSAIMNYLRTNYSLNIASNFPYFQNSLVHYSVLPNPLCFSQLIWLFSAPCLLFCLYLTRFECSHGMHLPNTDVDVGSSQLLSSRAVLSITSVSRLVNKWIQSIHFGEHWNNENLYFLIN